jgi:tetratricopeptide (TPR) repeat protein
VAYYNRGLGYQNKGDADRAIAAYTKAAELDPTDPAPFVNRGLLRMERQDYAAAIEDYDRALKAVPDFSLAHYNKGRAYELSGNLPEAINAYRKFLQSIGPENAADAAAAKQMLAELERRVPQ